MSRVVSGKVSLTKELASLAAKLRFRLEIGYTDLIEVLAGECPCPMSVSTLRLDVGIAAERGAMDELPARIRRPG